MRTRGILAALLLAAARSMAQAPADGVSFEQARTWILETNGLIAASTAEVQAREEGVRAAAPASGPVLAVGLERFGAELIEATVEQTFELGGKRRQRRAAAQSEAAVAKGAREQAVLELEAEIARRFIPIATLTSKLALIDSMVQASSVTLEQIRRRVDAGASRKTDLMQARIEAGRLSLERLGLESERASACRAFAALGDGRAELERVAGTLNSEERVPDAAVLLQAQKASPWMVMSQSEREGLDLARLQLRAEAFPDLWVSAGVLHSIERSETAPVASFAVNLPVFNRTGVGQTRLRLETEAFDRRHQAEQRLSQAHIESLRGSVLQHDRAMTSLRDARIPLADSVCTVLREYYAAGSATMLELMEAQSEALGLRMEIVDTQGARAEVLAELMLATSHRISIVK